eukprot:6207882-Pleurochrysis_carterae.AAC.1
MAGRPLEREDTSASDTPASTCAYACAHAHAEKPAKYQRFAHRVELVQQLKGLRFEEPHKLLKHKHNDTNMGGKHAQARARNSPENNTQKFVHSDTCTGKHTHSRAHP